MVCLWHARPVDRPPLASARLATVQCREPASFPSRVSGRLGSSARDRCCQRTIRHTTHHQDLPEKVTIVRRRHPFEGKSLAVLQATHRHGRLYLLLILPDGSKSLIPADWTDVAPTVQPPCSVSSKQIASLGSLEDLFHARAVVDALLGRLIPTQNEEANSAVTKEGVLAAKSDSLRPTAQGNLRMGNAGERTQGSRDRNSRKAHRPRIRRHPQSGGKS